MNCPRHRTEREGLDLLYNLHDGEHYIRGIKATVRNTVGSITQIKYNSFTLRIAKSEQGGYVTTSGTCSFRDMFCIKPHDIRAHHISKTQPQCCPVRCCCPQCCPCEMTVRFEAPEPTGWELLRKVAKPAMTITICGKVFQSDYVSGRVRLYSPYDERGLDLMPEQFTHGSPSDNAVYFGKSIDVITRSDIEILFDPTEAK